MKEENGNIISSDGKILFFSIENFVNQICKEYTCFICGAKKNDVEFNDEHVANAQSVERDLGNGL
jgi:hypothetical protein